MYVTAVHHININEYHLCGVHFTLEGAKQYLERKYHLPRGDWTMPYAHDDAWERATERKTYTIERLPFFGR